MTNNYLQLVRIKALYSYVHIFRLPTTGRWDCSLRADVSYFLPPAEKGRLRNGAANRVPVSCCSGFKFRINYDNTVLFSVPVSFPSDRSMIEGRTGLRGGIWIFLTEALRTAFTEVDVTSELRSFDERSTDSSKRVRFSGEAEFPTLSFPSVSIFFHCESCLESFGTIIAKKVRPPFFSRWRKDLSAFATFPRTIYKYMAMFRVNVRWTEEKGFLPEL